MSLLNVLIRLRLHLSPHYSHFNLHSFPSPEYKWNIPVSLFYLKSWPLPELPNSSYCLSFLNLFKPTDPFPCTPCRSLLLYNDFVRSSDALHHMLFVYTSQKTIPFPPGSLPFHPLYHIKSTQIYIYIYHKNSYLLSLSYPNSK